MALPTFAAQSNIEPEIVSAKQALAHNHAQEYRENYSLTDEAKEREKNIVDLVCKMQANVIDKSIACSELESIGVYELKAPVTKNEAAIPYSTEPSNVKINDVTVLFDSYNNQWLVCGGGYWPDDSKWIKDVPTNFWPSVGQQLNVGGYDGIGVKLYNTSGTYNTRVKRSYAYYSDGDNDYYNYNPMICEGRKGAFFEYQDKAVVTATTGFFSSYKYIGKHFAAMVIYDSNFANFNGYARTNYIHTWSNAQRINVVNCVGMVAVGGDIVEAEKRQPLFPGAYAILKYRAFIGIGMTVNTAEGKKRHKGIGGVKHYNRYIVFIAE